jgi:membrane protease YdiL (CAAX protease family)
MTALDSSGNRSLPIGVAVLGVAIPNAALLFPFGGMWLRLAVAASLLGIVAAVRLSRGAEVLLRPSVHSWLVAIVCTAILYAAVWLFTRIPAVAAASAVIRDSAAASGTRFGLGLALVVGVTGEELFWRGAVIPALGRRWSAPVATVAAAALAALGFAAAPMWLLPLAVFGTALAWNALFLYTRDLSAVILCHFAWDVLVLAAPPF